MKILLTLLKLSFVFGTGLVSFVFAVLFGSDERNSVKTDDHMTALAKESEKTSELIATGVIKS